MRSSSSSVLLAVFLFTGCYQEIKREVEANSLGQPEALTFTAEPAPEWTALMERTSGWFGADGIYSIPLDGVEDQGVEGKQTLFIFSDTYIGEVENNVPRPDNIMVNNS